MRVSLLFCTFRFEITSQEDTNSAFTEKMQLQICKFIQNPVLPSTIFGVFKGFLTRAHRICSPNRLQEEVEFLVNMFEENGYDRERFEDIAKRFEQQSSLSPDSTIERQDEGNSPVVKLPWIPRIGPKLRKSFKKHGVKVVFTSGPSLKDLLCQHKCSLPKKTN